MGPLIAHCPKTSAAINTGIDTDHKSLAKAWDKTVRVSCPHCHEEHEIKVRDAFVRGEISLFQLRGEQSPVPALQAPAAAISARRPS